MTVIENLTASAKDHPPDYGKFLIHGRQGSGKTWTASTIANAGKTLFIDMVGEKGVKSFQGSPQAVNIDVARPASVTDLDDIFWELDKGQHSYKAVVIDSVTSLQKMTMRYLLGHDETAVKEIRQGTAPAQIQTWGQALDIMTDTATFWYGLADGDRKNPMHVVMTAQTKVDIDIDSGFTIRTPDVQRGALSIMIAAPDYVLYTDLEEDTDNNDDDGNTTRHIVRFGNDPEYRIKARIPYKLRGKLPSVLGRKSSTNLVGLGRTLELGGIPAKKTVSDSK